jgi:hypothetical protein
MRRGFTVDEADVVFEYVRVPTHLVQEVRHFRFRRRTLVSLGPATYPSELNVTAYVVQQVSSGWSVVAAKVSESARTV